MKILLTGASGLLGYAYARAALRRGHELTALYHTRQPELKQAAYKLSLPGTDLDALTSLCLDSWPEAIVHCAAVSSPAAVEAQPELAQAINVALPRHLAQIATHLGARLLHISTDMVFDGRVGAPYRSTDMPAPANLYGQTKLMAEREVLEHDPEDPVVLRIPILMGNSPSGARSVHEKLLAAVRRGERPRLYTDEVRQPASAENVADVMLELTERRDLHGLFHWAGADRLSRYEMGIRILEHFGLPKDAVEPARHEDEPASANRPADLSFHLEPLVNKLKTRPATFQEQLDELTRVEPLRG